MTGHKPLWKNPMPTYEFFSEDWLKEIERLIRSQIDPAAINYASTSLLTVFENCPNSEEKALFIQTHKGELTQILAVEKPYPQTEFAISGEYTTFLKVMRKQLDPMTALMSGELHFAGNMIRAMGLVSLIEPLYQVIAEIPTNFE